MDINSQTQSVTTQTPPAARQVPVSSTAQQPSAANASVANGNSPASGATPAPAADTLTISNKRYVTQQVISQHINIALEIGTSPASATPGNTSTDPAIDPADAAVQKIQALKVSDDGDDSDDDKHNRAVQTVRIQVEQGFQQASFALREMGILDATTANTVDQSRSQVDAAIDQAANNPAPATQSAEPAQAGTTAVSESALNTVTAQRDQSTSLQLTTLDGDVVTVNLSRSQSVSAGQVDSTGASLVYAGSSSSTQMDINIEGDLSEKESNAIRKAVDRINELAAKLFNGETGSALEKLSDVEINTKQLAGMTMSMSSSISYQAVSAYTQVSNIAADGGADTNPALNPQQAVTSGTGVPVSTQSSNQVNGQASSQTSSTGSSTPGSQASPAATSAGVANTGTTQPASPAGSAASIGSQAVKEVEAAVNDTVASTPVQDPFVEVRKLFAAIAEMFAAQSNNVESEHKDFIKSLFNDVVDRMEDEHHDSDNDDVEQPAAA